MPEYFFTLPLIPKNKKAIVLEYLESKYVPTEGYGKLYASNKREQGKLIGISISFRQCYQSDILANRELCDLIDYLYDNDIPDACKTICAVLEP